MAPARVIEGLDVVECREPSVGPGTPARAIDHLGLETGKEALGHRVVIGVANPARALRDARLAAVPAEGQARVLGPSIAVVDEACPLVGAW